MKAISFWCSTDSHEACDGVVCECDCHAGAMTPPRTWRPRVHLERARTSWNGRLQPACTFTRGGKWTLTTDREQVTCHHCRRIIREMSA